MFLAAAPLEPRCVSTCIVGNNHVVLHNILSKYSLAFPSIARRYSLISVPRPRGLFHASSEIANDRSALDCHMYQKHEKWPSWSGHGGKQPSGCAACHSPAELSVGPNDLARLRGASNCRLHHLGILPDIHTQE